MKRTRIFKESLKLVWKSSPYWASANSALSLFKSFLPLLLLLLVKNLIDAITLAAGSNGEAVPERIFWLIGLTVAIYLLDELSGELSAFVKQKQALKLESFMYGLLHRKSVSLDLINFENPHYFDTLSRAAREAPWRPGNILNNLIILFRSSISLLLMAGLLLSLNWWIALLMVAVNLPAVWLRLHFAELIYSFQRKQTPEARKAAYFNWILTGDRPARELRLFGLGEHFITLFRISFMKSKEEELEILRKRTLIGLVSDLIKAAALFTVLYHAAVRTVSGELTLGMMAMLILAFRQGMIYLKEILGSAAGLYEDSLYTSDIFEFLSLREEIIAEKPVVSPGSLKEKIKLENISFTYPSRRQPAIKDLSLDINRGEIIALVGPNGSGKSTLVKLLCRLYDCTGGKISYDGSDIRNMDPEGFRKQFSVVFQDFMLYNLTAGENISLGDVSAPPDSGQVESAAGKISLDRLIEALPEGYDTKIGNLFDDSLGLSWGEWQRIAIARALYRNSSVLVLDEPSSALDTDTEFEIFTNLKEILKGRTCILISHRLANVSLADRIVVLSGGTIEEAGTHQELMNRKGTYYKMYIRQSGRFDNDK